MDDDGDGYAEQLLMVASGLDKPHGLFFANNDLLVAGETTLYRLLDAARLPLPEVKIISNNLPDGGGHWTRSVVVDGQGRIYVSSGSSCNVCEEKDPRRGAVWRFAPGDGEGKLFASGLRNSVGLAFHPLSGELWGSDNGRDRLGDDLPPDEINLLRAGLDYGWPYCYGAKVPDPALGIPERCATSESPQVLLQAHSAPLGVTFGEGLVASEPLRNSLLVAFHGSWNRTQPTGYKLVSIPFSQDRPSGEVKDLVTGWLVDGNAWGRPVALAIGPQGDLFVTDDRAGAVYRIIFPDEKRSP
ncbi:MAG: hypothetical protein C0624_12500 [Desulfuromonas sp.]|nr:MAG: hypothetical protein C0624_12500 [Desulfuromonas sp.]